jgi:putative two-component system response regulator
MLARGELALARILIVDDQASWVTLLRDLLIQEGFVELAVTTDPRQAPATYRSFHPDLVLLGLHQPGPGGSSVLELIQAAIPATEYLPILVLTSETNRECRTRALASGAADFITESFDRQEVMLRIRNLLTTRFLQQRLQDQARWLEHEVVERTQALEQVHYEVCDRLARAAEFRDDVTGQHTRRVGRSARMLAERIGVKAETVDLLERAAPLHDLGKIGIPDRILLKPGRLDADEFTIMRGHAEIGATLLSGGQSPLLQLAEQIARSHHEKWDGSGYPHGLTGDTIPLVGRVVAVADFFDAVTHARPYREAWPLSRAVEEVRVNAGRHFDPDLVEAFLDLPSAELAA